MSKRQAAQAMGVDSRELRRWESGEVPGGLTLIQLLNTYGVLVTPAPPDQLPRSVNAELQKLRGDVHDRLVALEATVDARGRDATTALKALAAGIRRIERRLDAGDPPASQTGRGQ